MDSDDAFAGLELALFKPRPTSTDAQSQPQPPQQVQELTPQEKAKKITVELFSLQSSPPFEAMLAEEVVQDYVLQHLSVRKQELKEASLHLSAGMGPLDSQDEWRKQDAFAKADATVDEVLLTAKDTVLKMPTKGQQFQDLLEKMSVAICPDRVYFCVLIFVVLKRCWIVSCDVVKTWSL